MQSVGLTGDESLPHYSTTEPLHYMNTTQSDTPDTRRRKPATLLDNRAVALYGYIIQRFGNSVGVNYVTNIPRICNGICMLILSELSLY